MSDEPRPLIIKRKIVKGGGHHGGAWKVAYADFVTAMMAFFLLMWLLNATTEEQRQGIADYFAPAIPIHRQGGGGDGAFGGESIFVEDELVRDGTGGRQMNTSDSNQSRGDQGNAPQVSQASDQLDPALLDTLLKAASGEVLLADDLMRHIETRVSDEGLIIDVFARDGAPIFASGSAVPEPRLDALLGIVARVLSLVGNDISIEGHTDATPFGRAAYTNWELSTDRANASRRSLERQGLNPNRMVRITGRADRDPITEDSTDSRNRRIVITVLRSDITLK